jgi:lipoprotein-anchoring transpeptidase ErfK/SrfK
MIVVGALAALSAPSAAAAQGQPDAPAPAPTPEPEAFDVPAPSRKAGATVAQIATPTFARRKLGSAKRGRRVGLDTEWSAQEQTLLVLDGATRHRRDWVKLLLPDRPNGSTGWVPREHVALARTRYWIEVRTGARRVTVYRNGKRVRRLRAVVGTPSTPTPHGLAAIYERNRQPDPGAFLGPWSIPLTVHSNVLESFGGGPGRVAIHGRAGASLRDPLGSARSHGCIRVLNRHVSWMARTIPAGTPVNLRR